MTTGSRPSVPVPSNEEERLKALAGYYLQEAIPEEVFEDIIRLAAQICRTPISHIGIMERDRQWLLAKQGLTVQEAPREETFCSYTIMNPETLTVVEDARKDERFRENPYTSGPTPIVFYAGVPLLNPQGFPLATLCVIDHRPRQLTDNQLLSLQALGKWVSTQFELHKVKRELARAEQYLKITRHETTRAKYSLQTQIRPLVKDLLARQESSGENPGTPSAVQDLRVLNGYLDELLNPAPTGL
ncbi:GAF domain-containing protein [Larkinella soli]|uniref:GAF domain-containing protein n=1 Tax=Larkinella soli TaxID=1770527 RepID=UPI0013E29D75|nr:GAF domain-containing protein [Larkinella soli]